MKFYKPARSRQVVATAVILLSGASVLPANAFERVGEGVGFNLNCFGLMLSNPAEHAAVCNPTLRNDVPASLVTSAPSAPIVMLDPEPLPEPEPEPEPDFDPGADPEPEPEPA